jgi:hypothetical protein
MLTFSKAGYEMIVHKDINIKCLIVILLCVCGTRARSQNYYEWMLSTDTTSTHWVQQRVKNALNASPEVVSFPMVVRSLGWGCRCPEYYMGVSPNVAEGPWIAAFKSKGKPLPQMSEFGSSLIVKGYFTGVYKEIDLRNEDGEPEEWLYIVPEFKVLSYKINKMPDDGPAPAIVKKKL